jgi:peroxiredoxin Q/BCP
MYAVRFIALGVAISLVSGTRGDYQKPVELKVGDAAPEFEARTDADTTWESRERVGKKWLVVYFYPGDFTPGCTAQAKSFAAAMDKLVARGVEVVGVSGDSVQIHEKFKQDQKLNFTLLSDEDGAIAKKFGVPFLKGATVKARDSMRQPFEFTRAGTAARWTFIIDKDGKIAYKNTRVTPAKDAQAITDFIDKAEEK